MCQIWHIVQVKVKLHFAQTILTVFVEISTQQRFAPTLEWLGLERIVKERSKF